MNLIQCTKEQHEAFIERYKDRLIQSIARIYFPPMAVWYDKQAKRGSIESVVAVKTLNHEVSIACEYIYRIPEGGVL